MRASEKYAQKPELLKAHPILKRLLTLKRTLTTLEDLNLTEDDSEDEDEDEDDSMTWNDIMMDGEVIWNMNEGLDEDELRELLEDVESQKNLPKPQEPPKKKRKTSSTPAESTVPVFDLVEPEFSASKPSSSRIRTASGVTDAYGEATSLQHADVADKTARKKSLRFHISKIESASARRQGARNQAAGGDDDLPYRERRKEKEARLAKEAAPKVKKQGGEDLDNTEPEPKSEKQTEEQDYRDHESEEPDGYYELIKKKSKEKKDQKKAEYEAIRNAARYVKLTLLIHPALLRAIGSIPMRATPPDLVRLPVQFWLTKVSLLTVQKVYAIPESRNVSSSKKRRRKFHLKKQCTRAG